MPLKCDIVTQERTVYSEEVDYVSLPGTEGVMGILPNHSSLLTALSFGEVMVRKDGDEEFFAIGGGNLLCFYCLFCCIGGYCFNKCANSYY